MIDKDEALISIGGLSRASGISVETIRNWEKRYGFPQAFRRSSGHRRYDMDVIPRLKLIREALALGYKPSFAVPALEGELRVAISQVPGPESESHLGSPAPTTAGVASEVSWWISCIERLDGDALDASMHKFWSLFGARSFILELAVPFLQQVGELWCRGDLNVFQEHMASETLQTFLSKQWRAVNSRAPQGPAVVLATLPDEWHALGLHLASVVAALRGFTVVFLGPNTPTREIVRTAEMVSAGAVLVGSSPAGDVEQASDELEQLRAELSSGVFVGFGGNAQVELPSGVDAIADFAALEPWLDLVERIYSSQS